MYKRHPLPKPASVSDEPACPPPLAVRSGDRFGRFATLCSDSLGSKWAFALAGLVIIVWAATGPLFHYSDTWQLVINTGTTIVTFLMVFLIQNTQNRDARAINLKLNELIRAIDAARDQMIDIESLSDLELKEIHARYEKIKADLPEPEIGLKPEIAKAPKPTA
ncbi:MAG TPA: low affinity iron permease family protein [Acidobacteriaceae bacterium]|nr:low affinity iron permease family protein [Acidobacteriaceae bacterium]